MDQELEVILRQVDVVIQIGESNLGFDHPEFGEVPGGVGVLGPKGRTEGVHVF